MQQRNTIPFENWYRILFYGVLFIIFFGHIANNHDPDFGWHLMVGQEIVSTLDVPGPIERLYPVEGVSWVDHEWLSNALLFIIYDAGPYGDMFLYGIFTFFAVLCLALIEYIARRWFGGYNQGRPESWFIFSSLLLYLATIVLLSYTAGIRLQIFSWLFFLVSITLFLLFLEKRRVRILWLLPVLIFFWTNLHGSFILGLTGTLSGLFLMVCLLPTSGKERFHMLSVGIASILATLFTPYGLKLWELVLIEYTKNDFYRTHLAEWLPVYVIPPFETASFVIFPLALTMLILASKKHLLSLWVFEQYPRLLTPFFIGYFLLAFFYVENRRHAPFFLFATLLLLIPLMVRTFELKKIFRPFLFGILIPFLVWCGIQSARQVSEIPKDPFSVAYAPDTPRGAVDFLKVHESELGSLRIFNHYSWGGYLEWTLPKWNFFIDGRMPQAPLFGKQNSYIEDYFRFAKSEDSLRGLVDEYQIELLLLDQNWKTTKKDIPLVWRYFVPETIVDTLNESGEWLDEYLDREWDLLYADDMSKVYRKRQSPPVSL